MENAFYGLRPASSGLIGAACAGVVLLTDAAKKNADCDSDGEVGSNDAVSLMRFLVHLISTLP